MEFITDYLRLMVGGNLNIRDRESDGPRDRDPSHEGEIPVGAVSKLADGLPAFGIVAAVMGVVLPWSRSAAARGAEQADRRSAGRYLSRHPAVLRLRRTLATLLNTSSTRRPRCFSASRSPCSPA